MDINDRRNAVGSGDFNNPKGTFSVTTHGNDEADAWAKQSVSEARGSVHSYYAGQKDTKTWSEATRLAKRRTDHEGRKWGFPNGEAYANSYQDHLVRVMAEKGRTLADLNGELHHRQSGYGRV